MGLIEAMLHRCQESAIWNHMPSERTEHGETHQDATNLLITQHRATVRAPHMATPIKHALHNLCNAGGTDGEHICQPLPSAPAAA